MPPCRRWPLAVSCRQRAKGANGRVLPDCSSKSASACGFGTITGAMLPPWFRRSREQAARTEGAAFSDGGRTGGGGAAQLITQAATVRTRQARRTRPQTPRLRECWPRSGGKQRTNRRKTGEKQAKKTPQPGRNSRDAWACRRQRPRACGFLARRPPGQKVSAECRKTACPPLCKIFSPPAVFRPACSPALSRSVVPPPRVLYFCTGPGSAPDTICGFLPGGLPSPAHPSSPGGRSTNGRPSGREPQERRYRCPERVSPPMS